jgi:hypothetical protein
MRTLLGQWGAIQSAVEARLPTQQLYSAIYNAQLDAGVTPGGFGFGDLNRLRSMAVGQRNASEAFARAPSSSPVDATMIGTAPWSRGLADRNLTPQWEVRFEHSVVMDNQLTTFWRTSKFDGVLPGSVGDVLDLVNADAADLSESYQVEHVGVGAVMITAV